MKLTDKYGNVLVVGNAIEKDGENLLFKANLLGTMPSTIYVKPENVWELWQMIPFSVMLSLPGMLLKGRKEARKKAINNL